MYYGDLSLLFTFHYLMLCQEMSDTIFHRNTKKQSSFAHSKNDREFSMGSLRFDTLSSVLFAMYIDMISCTLE